MQPAPQAVCGQAGMWGSAAPSPATPEGTHPGGGAVVGASLPLAWPLIGVPRSHTPCLGMGRGEAR